MSANSAPSGLGCDAPRASLVGDFFRVRSTWPQCLQRIACSSQSVGIFSVVLQFGQRSLTIVDIAMSSTSMCLGLCGSGMQLLYLSKSGARGKRPRRIFPPRSQTHARPPASRPPAGKPPAGKPPAGKPPASRTPAGKPPASGPLVDTRRGRWSVARLKTLTLGTYTPVSQFHRQRPLVGRADPVPMLPRGRTTGLVERWSFVYNPTNSTNLVSWRAWAGR